MSDPTAAELDRALAAFDAAQFDPRVLRRAAEAWATRAQNEHASIASFARFSLGLLAVGAPPQLIALAHRAALDEIAHAQMAFAIASAYSGTRLGPGRLDLANALDGNADLGTLVEATVLEGCVGETLSALEAREEAGLATEPAARVALARIADDEARHAELAWAFVRWAMEVEPGLVEPVGRQFRDVLARAAAGPPEARCFEPELGAFGFLSREAQSALRRRAIGEVLAPAAEAMTNRRAS